MKTLSAAPALVLLLVGLLVLTAPCAYAQTEPAAPIQGTWKAEKQQTIGDNAPEQIGIDGTRVEVLRDKSTAGAAIPTKNSRIKDRSANIDLDDAQFERVRLKVDPSGNTAKAQVIYRSTATGAMQSSEVLYTRVYCCRNPDKDHVAKVHIDGLCTKSIPTPRNADCDYQSVP
ncbi:hypothetical protein [Hymenobacter chitinivorans]|uniref:hypothetical protein n=1 Tax=Hymenobacter chitinivorans TaxID=89969 RepID=UPI000C242C8C|nr:hypothetical protein [Hymenobacter chitinivorans]